MQEGIKRNKKGMMKPGNHRDDQDSNIGLMKKKNHQRAQQIKVHNKAKKEKHSREKQRLVAPQNKDKVS